MHLLLNNDSLLIINSRKQSKMSNNQKMEFDCSGEKVAFGSSRVNLPKVKAQQDRITVSILSHANIYNCLNKHIAFSVIPAKT